MKFYAGIGSRETPEELLKMMTAIATCLEKKGYTLRSGGCYGPDFAFEQGVSDPNNKEVFIPWNGYASDKARKHKRYASEDSVYVQSRSDYQRARIIAAPLHPKWDRCSEAVQKMHCRNVSQILGFDLAHPVQFVICYGIPQGNTVKGGTGMAVSIANSLGIPVFNMYDQDIVDRLTKMILSV